MQQRYKQQHTVTESIRMMARVLRKLLHDATSIKEVMNLQSHREKRSKQDLEPLYHMAMLVQDFMQTDLQTIGIDDIVNLFCIV